MVFKKVALAAHLLIGAAGMANAEEYVFFGGLGLPKQHVNKAYEIKSTVPTLKEADLEQLARYLWNEGSIENLQLYISARNAAVTQKSGIIHDFMILDDKGSLEDILKLASLKTIDDEHYLSSDELIDIFKSKISAAVIENCHNQDPLSMLPFSIVYTHLAANSTNVCNDSEWIVNSNKWKEFAIQGGFSRKQIETIVNRGYSMNYYEMTSEFKVNGNDLLFSPDASLAAHAAGMEEHDIRNIISDLTNRGNTTFTGDGIVTRYYFTKNDVGFYHSTIQVSYSDDDALSFLFEKSKESINFSERKGKSNALVFYGAYNYIAWSEDESHYGSSFRNPWEFQRVAGLAEHYNVTLVVAEHEDDMYKALREADIEKTKLIIFNYHGNSSTGALSSYKAKRIASGLHDKEKYVINEEDTELKTILGRFNPDTVLISNSCENGSVKDAGKPIGHILHEYSGLTSISSTTFVDATSLQIHYEIPSQSRFYFNGKDVTVKFSNSKPIPLGTISK